MRGLMSRYLSTGANRRDDDSAWPRGIPAAWRDEKIEDPFDDLKIRQRMADLISRSALKSDKPDA